MVSAAAISILTFGEIRRGESLGVRLQMALDSRIVIEQAKGVLAERSRIGMDEAFQRLRGYARSHNRPPSDLARDVVNGATDIRRFAETTALGIAVPEIQALGMTGLTIPARPADSRSFFGGGRPVPVA